MAFNYFFLFIFFHSSAKCENISFYILPSTELAFLILVKQCYIDIFIVNVDKI